MRWAGWSCRSRCSGLSRGHAGAAGWGSVITTDTAFGLALIALFGTSLPAGLRALMLAFAAVDDVGGLLIIAFAYSGAIAPVGILVAGSHWRASSVCGGSAGFRPCPMSCSA
ncbi:Na+/H+ antiporter NhaA [Sphingomonas sp. I4]